EPQQELAATLWMNRHLPEGSSVLSFYLTKRYFSDHRWINAWRYPPAARLYLDNDIGEEIRIVRELDIDYVILVYGDPAPFDDENPVALFTRIGEGDVLEPVALVGGVMVLKFNPAAFP
ncbi:MAG: hypothetical protein JXA64_03950, partial [Candidatus Fermentibacteraceae bacterium]|nr:hypothetical protein [Candidatus Fermentibacteraceae bacterium]